MSTATHGNQAPVVDANAAADDAAPAPKRLIECVVDLRWRDLDVLNHVNNSAFLTYIEEARLQWFGQLQGPWFGETWMPVVAAVHVNYRAQLAWPGRIAVQLYCGRIGKSSLTLAHRIVDANDANDANDAQKLYSDGHTVLVWVNPADGKSVALPESVRKACA